MRIVIALVVAVAATTSAAQIAQKPETSMNGASAVLAPAGEPGDRLIVEGRVLANGATPVAGADLVLYHTDNTGCYSRDCADERNPGARSARLGGRLKTDGQGRYEFRTIKPAQYRGTSGPPAHIHYELTIGQRAMVPLELIFEGDNRLTPEIRGRAAKHDFFILCAPAKDADGTLRCRGADVILP